AGRRAWMRRVIPCTRINSKIKTHLLQFLAKALLLFVAGLF
ncbi:MAG: hypothetical protein ACI9WC_003465, partial [Arenicella sp.]